MLKDVLQDLRFAVRLLYKNPGFAAVVVLTLGLAIGANVTVFTIVNAVLFKGLPFQDSDRIVSVMSSNLAKRQDQLPASFYDFQDWQKQSKSFQGLAAAQMGPQNVSDAGLPTEQHSAARVSAGTFSLLGAKPLLGRDFLPEEDQGAGVNVAILGYSLWQKRYGGDPKILGRVVRLSEIDTTVIGVMPDGIKFPMDQELWTPLFPSGPASGLLKRENRTVLVYGRLAVSVGMEQAQSEMNLIAKRLQEEYPQADKGIGIRVQPYTAFFGGGTIRLLFLAMLGAVGFVLLIACANVANLLLSRSLTRAREVSIRAALGASRGRIVRQMLIESFLLAALGSAGGVILSLWGVRAFLLALPSDLTLPFWMDFSMDYVVMGYLVAVCLLITLFFGLVPALHASKVDLNETLKEGARGSGSGRARYLSRLLVVGEVSLALVLLVGAGLMIRSFLKLYEMSSGFENANVLTMGIYFAGGKYLAPEPRLNFLEKLEPELANVPGVETAALTSNLPLAGAYSWPFELEGQAPPAKPEDRPTVGGLEISSKYFEVLGIPLLRGRTFTPDEGREGKTAVIVNRRFVSKYWPGEDPIGKRLRMVRDKEQPWLTVVGEVPDVKQNNYNGSKQQEMDPIIYVPYRQDQQSRFVSILARTRGDAHSLATPLRKLVQSINSEMPVMNVLTLPEHFARLRWFLRLFGSLFAIFAVIGLVLAAVGIYAVMAYSVSQRTREIGIRMALGAQQHRIQKLVLGQGLKLAGIGVAIGLAGSFAITRVMASFLIGVTPTDPTTFVAVALLLTLIALLACYVPARRAIRVQPVLALRAE